MDKPVVSIEAYVWGATPTSYGIFIDVKEDRCVAFIKEGTFVYGDNTHWLTGKQYRLTGKAAAAALSKEQTDWCHIGNLMSDGTFVYTQEL